MKQYKLHKNVKPKYRTKFPFPNMQIGDVFFVPCNKYFTQVQQSKIHNAARRWREKHQEGFRVRTWTTKNEHQRTVIAVERTH